MDLSNSPADSIRRPARGRLLRRLLALLSIGVLAGAFGAHAALADGVQLTLSTNAATPGTPVTMTAVVTSANGVPSGTVTFTDVGASPAAPLDTENLVPTGTNTSAASFTTSALGIGTYTIQANYTADFTAFLSNISDLTSPSQALAIAASPPPPTTYPTEVTLSAPASVTSTQPVTLTATVARTSGPAGTPTGTVDFIDTVSGTSVPLGSATLVGGVATLDLTSLSAGPHSILALYDGDASDNTSSSLPSSVDSAPPADSRLQTSSVVTVSPAEIAVGDPVTILATITQSVPAGGQAPQPPGGDVTFTTDSSCGNNVLLGTVPLGQGPAGVTVAANQAALRTSTLQSCSYTITASYSGDVYDQISAASTPLVVVPPRTAAAIDYTGDTSVEYGHTASLSAVVTDLGGTPLPDRSVTFAVGAQQCLATTDNTGLASCSLAVTQDVPGGQVTTSVARDLQTEGNSLDTPFAVTQQPTTLTTGFQPGATATTLTGTLVGDLGPLGGQTITLSLGNETCSAATAADGTGSCTVPPLTGGTTATLSGLFAGTTNYGASSAADRQVQVAYDTTLAYDGATTAVYGGPATLSATLAVVGGGALAGRTVTFTLGTQTCTGSTDANGVASCTIAVVAEDAGPATVSASYAGDSFTAPTDASAAFTVTPAPTATVAAAPAVGAATTALSATLTSGGAPLAGRTLTLTFGSTACSAATGADGVATCSVPTPSGATATFTASFAGETDYAASSDSRTVALPKPTTISYLGKTGTEYSDPALLAARVTGPDGHAVPNGENVTFTLGTQSCTGRTFLGYAFCVLTVDQPAGAYTVTASYGGDATYAASTSTVPFTVRHEDTAVRVTTGPALAGSTATLGGTLLADGAQPVEGRTLTLTLGSQSCTAVTGASGAATCSVTAPTALGPTSATASFAGDPYYAADDAAAQAVVYAYAPGGGSFVVGDRSASGTVTFWGAQWAKQNSLSGGPAPSAFKGFALHGAAQCGASWSTDPGNSAPPPSGPLPAYMAVAVTSGASKSGAAISGNTVAVVVVKTNAGYAPNPGHAGTGTVVATVCGPANDTRGGGTDDSGCDR